MQRIYRSYYTLGNPFDCTQVGDNVPCEDLTQSDDEIVNILCHAPSMSQPEPCSPVFSSTSYLFLSPVPSSFVSSPSPSFFRNFPPSSPRIASSVSPSPGSSMAPAMVHLTPLCPVPVQATPPSSQLATGSTPPFMSPSVVFEKMERCYRLNNYYISNYYNMSYEARCFAYYWCQQYWNRFLSTFNICKQQRNQNSEVYYAYGDNDVAPAARKHRTEEDEVIFPSDALHQLSVIPGVLEIAVEMGYLSDGNSYIFLFPATK